MRRYARLENKDPRTFLEGIFLGMLACVLLYAAFGLLLVHIQSDRLASAMDLFLTNGLAAVIMPDDPHLTGFRHQIGSALLLGISLGIWTAVLAAAACLVPWMRGSWGRPSDFLLNAMLVPVCLCFMFSREAAFVSIVWSLLTPVFFLVPWTYSVRRPREEARNRIRLAFFVFLFLLPFCSSRDLSSLGLRDAMLNLPVTREITHFYYDHTLLAAEVIKPVRRQTQKVISLSDEMQFPAILPHGSLWLKSADPCSVMGSSLIVSTKRLDCPHFVPSGAGPAESGDGILLEAGRRSDDNRAVRRGIRWFLRPGLVVASGLFVVWLALFVEDAYRRHRAVALLLVAGALFLAASGFRGRYLEYALLAAPDRVSSYASSASESRRYIALACLPHALAAEELESMALDPSPRIRHSAFVQMGERADQKFLDAFRKGLADPEQIVRTKVCWGLGEIGGEDALRLLEDVLARDPSWYVRDYAYNAIGRIAPSRKKVETL